MPIRHPRHIDTSSRHAFPPAPVASRMYRNIAVSFLSLAVIVIGVVVWMSAVKASVRVRVRHDTTKIDSTVDISKNPEQGQLQGRVVEGVFDSAPQEFSVKIQATSSAIAQGVTSGRVRIINNYSKAQPLVKTTRLLTADGKLFRIRSTINIPSGKSVEVEAYSDQEGADFEIPAGTKFTIPGLWVDLQKWIYAEAITPFTGKAVATKVVSSGDIENAHSTLSDSVMEQAKKTLVAEAGIPADALADDCPDTKPCWQVVYVVKPLEKKSNVAAGQPSGEFLAQVKMKVTGVFYPRRDMELLVRSKLRDRLPEGRDLISFDPQSVVYELEQTDAVSEKARVHFTAQASSRLSPQMPALSKDSIAGLSINEAKQKIASVDGVEFVEISLRPSWARHIPTKRAAIEITIE